MAEHVTIFSTEFDSPSGREMAALERLGRGRQVRGELRDAEAAFEWAVSAHGRLPIVHVTRHVCHHDTGEEPCVLTAEKVWP